MSHRDLDACLFAALAVVAVAGLAGVLRTCLKGTEPGSVAIVVTGASMLCGIYAACGWGWFLATGVLR